MIAEKRAARSTLRCALVRGSAISAQSAGVGVHFLSFPLGAVQHRFESGLRRFESGLRRSTKRLESGACHSQETSIFQTVRPANHSTQQRQAAERWLPRRVIGMVIGELQVRRFGRVQAMCPLWQQPVQ